jgi:CheY-like chemotaxis protein
VITKPVLYAEDEETDSFFLKRAFKQVGIANPLVIVPNGQEAIDYMAGMERYSNRDEFPLPCLVLLDLNMPKKSGIEVLKWIREEQTTCTVPVIILTSSLQEADIRRSYLAGANAYLAKPSQPDELIIMVKTTKEFWLGQNRTCE